MSLSGRNETVYIILPVCGKPYVAKDKIIKQDGSKNVLDVEQNLVSGNVQWLNKKTVKDIKTTIQPLFVMEEPRWAMADKIIKGKKRYELLVNENGIESCCANMATIRLNRGEGIMMPYFGILAIKIKEDNMKMIDTDGVLPYKNFLEDEDEEELEQEKFPECEDCGKVDYDDFNYYNMKCGDCKKEEDSKKE